MRDLVTRKEALLIDKYGYEFEQASSPKLVIEVPSVQIYGIQDSFQKLSGKESNFLLLRSGIDVEPIRNKLAQISPKAWGKSNREYTFEAYRKTQALLLIHDDDFRHYNPTYNELYSKFEKELKPVLDFIADNFQHDGFVVRLIFAKLEGHGKIPVHTDGVYSLLKCHRIHVPIITNEKAIFVVGGEQKVMRAGEIWEINDATLHGVDNQSDEDRIHMIIDWVPNSTVRQEDKYPASKKGTESSKSSAASDRGQYAGRDKVGRNDPCPCKSGESLKNAMALYTSEARKPHQI